MIKVGDKMPEGVFQYFTDAGEKSEMTVEQLTKGKKVVLVGIPGAFTPTCQNKHINAFIDREADIKAKGVDTIACMAVNDAFVMNEFSKATGATGKVLMLADGAATYAKKMGTEVDLSDFGMGVRTRRFVMVIEDGEVKGMNIETGGELTCTTKDDAMALL
ncbi:unnamed protein product [Pedinophyceae sp. YPF-701]|nr:unnamed protein product [Pedinophyceae sp. YPF-701]